jgi:hypothetical protein
MEATIKMIKLAAIVSDLNLSLKSKMRKSKPLLHRKIDAATNVKRSMLLFSYELSKL